MRGRFRRNDYRMTGKGKGRMRRSWALPTGKRRGREVEVKTAREDLGVRGRSRTT